MPRITYPAKINIFVIKSVHDPTFASVQVSTLAPKVRYQNIAADFKSGRSAMSELFVKMRDIIGNNASDFASEFVYETMAYDVMVDSLAESQDILNVFRKKFKMAPIDRSSEIAAKKHANYKRVIDAKIHYCSTCDVSFYSNKFLIKHNETKRHKSKFGAIAADDIEAADIEAADAPTETAADDPKTSSD